MPSAYSPAAESGLIGENAASAKTRHLTAIGSCATNAADNRIDVDAGAPAARKRGVQWGKTGGLVARESGAVPQL
jgi:hypothetical protein